MFFDILQIFLAIIIIALIILQQRGSEAGVLFGTRTEFFWFRRGFEKNIYYLTWILIAGFVFISLLKTI